MKTIIRVALAIVAGVGLNRCIPEQPAVPGGGNVPTSDWTLQTEGSETLLDIFFVDANRGWAVGENNVVLATTDGGQIWPVAPTSFSSVNLKTLFFLDGTTGWVAGGLPAASGTPNEGQIFITQMGGAYPTEQKKLTQQVNNLFFLNANRGWAVCDSSILMQTVNGGDDWTQSQIGVNRRLFRIQFLNLLTGWAAADGGGIFRTKDGSTWIPDESGITSDIYGLQFVDTLHAWACGASNTVLRRTLDGNNKPVWISSTIGGEPVTTKWQDLFFVSDKNGWIVGTGGVVYKTTDGGINWEKQRTETSADLNGIHMVSSTRGWVVGTGGTVMTYTPL